MTIRHLVSTGAITAQTAIDTAAATLDHGAAALRVGVLAFLSAHAADVVAGPSEQDLLGAYREWLAVANQLYQTGDQTLIREYTHRGAILRAELELSAAEGRSDGAA